MNILASELNRKKLEKETDLFVARLKSVLEIEAIYTISEKKSFLFCLSESVYVDKPVLVLNRTKINCRGLFC